MKDHAGPHQSTFYYPSLTLKLSFASDNATKKPIRHFVKIYFFINVSYAKNGFSNQRERVGVAGYQPNRRKII